MAIKTNVMIPITTLSKDRTSAILIWQAPLSAKQDRREKNSSLIAGSPPSFLVPEGQPPTLPRRGKPRSAVSKEKYNVWRNRSSKLSMSFLSSFICEFWVKVASSHGAVVFIGCSLWMVFFCSENLLLDWQEMGSMDITTGSVSWINIRQGCRARLGKAIWQVPCEHGKIELKEVHRR